MKRKHYPVVTGVVATLLVVLPLLPLMLSLHGRSTGSEIASDEFRDNNSRSSIQVPVASLISQQLAAPTRQEPKQLPSLLPAVEVSVAIPSISPPGIDVPEPADAAVSDLPEIPLASESMAPNFRQPAPVLAEIEVAELPTRPDAGASYYEATGHLALRTQPQVPDPLANHVESPAPSKGQQAVAHADDVTSEKSRKSKGRKSKSEGKKSAEAVSDLAHSDPGSPVDAPQSRIQGAGDSDALIEDVVIQTPAESATVGRVENVVAMTRARGWPIALIRSDLPDDVWWVQQVVGIQGNSFAARVNFGNEYTLSGSAFSMVIVFLDSPDEVRRFRIAKQFKDIPEGVRHSREFHYIRN